MLREFCVLREFRGFCADLAVFAPNPRILRQIRGLCAKSADYAPNPRIMRQIRGFCAKSADYAPNPRNYAREFGDFKRLLKKIVHTWIIAYPALDISLRPKKSDVIISWGQIIFHNFLSLTDSRPLSKYQIQRAAIRNILNMHRPWYQF